MYLFLKLDRQEERHSVKLVDAPNQILVFLQHRLPHSLRWHLRIEIDAILEQVKVGGTLESE